LANHQSPCYLDGFWQRNDSRWTVIIAPSQSAAINQSPRRNVS